MDAEQASQVLQRLQVLEQAATEQLTARRGAERALVEAQTRIAQLDRALQQGGRPGTAAGQVVDTRVLGRPDKWDGSEKAWPNWSFVMKAFAGAIDQALSADMTTAECSTDAVSNDTMTGEKKKARSVQLYFVLIMLCSGRALDRIANAPHGWHGGVANALSSVLSKEQCETCCDDARSVGVSFGHKRCGEQSRDDGTDDQRVREIREHRNSGISEDWHRDSSSSRMTDENASHHEVAQVGNIPGHQNGSDKRQASPECSEGEIGRRNGCGCFHERIQRCFQRFWQETDSEVVCWCCEKKGHRVSDCRKGDSKGKSNKEKFKGKCYKCGKTRHMSKECRSKETSAFEAGDELAETGCIEMASVDLIALEIGAVQLPEKGNIIRIGIDPRAAVTVSQECCGRLSDARHARQSEELQTSVRQSSSRSGYAKSPSQTQRRVPQIREPESCGHGQSVDGSVRDERHGTRCLLVFCLLANGRFFFNFGVQVGHATHRVLSTRRRSGLCPPFVCARFSRAGSPREMGLGK